MISVYNTFSVFSCLFPYFFFDDFVVFDVVRPSVYVTFQHPRHIVPNTVTVAVWVHEYYS